MTRCNSQQRPLLFYNQGDKNVKIDLVGLTDDKKKKISSSLSDSSFGMHAIIVSY